MQNIQDIEAKDLRELIKSGRDDLEIIDVREQSEFDIVKIKGSKLIPMGELEMRVDEIDWKKDVIFVCLSGSRSRLMASLLVDKNKKIKNLKFGIHECYRDGKGENLEISEDIDRYF